MRRSMLKFLLFTAALASVAPTLACQKHVVFLKFDTQRVSDVDSLFIVGINPMKPEHELSDVQKTLGYFDVSKNTITVRVKACAGLRLLSYHTGTYAVMGDDVTIPVDGIVDSDAPQSCGMVQGRMGTGGASGGAGGDGVGGAPGSGGDTDAGGNAMGGSGGSALGGAGGSAMGGNGAGGASGATEASPIAESAARTRTARSARHRVVMPAPGSFPTRRSPPPARSTAKPFRAAARTSSSSTIRSTVAGAIACKLAGSQTGTRRTRSPAETCTCRCSRPHRCSAREPIA